MYDCAIVGTGPAGLSAAINLKLHNKSFIWFGSKNLSDKISKAEKIANYPGFPMISGKMLCDYFAEHIQQMDINITDKMVTMIGNAGDGYMLLADNEMYQAKTVILATGVVSAKSIPGEQEYVGRGVSYCATCDGFLYKGKTIAVYCASPRFEHEVQYLSQMADTVQFIPGYKDYNINLANVIKHDSPCAEVTGDLKLRCVLLDDGTRLEVDGFFILRDAIAPATLVPGLNVERGHIPVDRNMCTNLSGCFACGDCTGAPYQYAKAVGEGNIAAHSVIKYLARTE